MLFNAIAEFTVPYRLLLRPVRTRTNTFKTVERPVEIDLQDGESGPAGAFTAVRRSVNAQFCILFDAGAEATGGDWPRSCLSGEVLSAPSKDGGIVALTEMYGIDPLLVEVDTYGNVRLYRINTIAETTGADYSTWIIGFAPQEIPIRRQSRIRDAAAYLAMDADAAAGAIASDLETMVNATLEDFLVKSSNDPRLLAAMPPIFTKGSKEQLMMRMSDAVQAFVSARDWPATIDFRPMTGQVDEAVLRRCIERFGSRKAVVKWSAEATPYLIAIYEENQGTVFGATPITGKSDLLSSGWGPKAKDLRLTAEKPTAHEVLEARARLEAAFPHVPKS